MEKKVRWVNEIIDKGFLVDGLQMHTGLLGVGESIVFMGHAVEIGFGGEFNGALVCGCDQEFKIGGRWVKAKDLCGKRVSFGTRVLSVRDVGIKTLYDYVVSGVHSFRTHINGLELITHNLSIGQYIPSSKGKERWYKYIPYDATKSVNIEKSVQKPKEKINIDQSVLVQLGGTFERIGEEDEAIGGGDQKVGAGV